MVTHRGPHQWKQRVDFANEYEPCQTDRKSACKLNALGHVVTLRSLYSTQLFARYDTPELSRKVGSAAAWLRRHPRLRLYGFINKTLKRYSALDPRDSSIYFLDLLADFVVNLRNSQSLKTVFRPCWTVFSTAFGPLLTKQLALRGLSEQA